MDNKIVINVIGFGITHTTILNEDVSADQFIEVCAKMAESLTFSPEQVRQALRLALNNRE